MQIPSFISRNWQLTLSVVAVVVVGIVLRSLTFRAGGDLSIIYFLDEYICLDTWASGAISTFLVLLIVETLLGLLLACPAYRLLRRVGVSHAHSLFLVAAFLGLLQLFLFIPVAIP